jgi:hypothetical protein
MITVGASGGGTADFTDNFDRADNTSLGSRWAETAGDLAIRQNKLVNLARGDNTATVLNLVGADQSASADFSSSDNNTGPGLGVLLRYKDAKNHYRLYLSVAGGARLLIAKLVNGVEIPLKTVNIPNPAVGAPFHLTGSVKGTTLTVSIPGLTFSVTDATYDSGGVGVLVKTGPPGTHTADNFCAAVSTGSCQ